MKRWSKVLLIAFVAGLPLTMAPTSGGFPSRPKFQAVGVGQAAGAAGTINGVAPSDWSRLSQANAFTAVPSLPTSYPLRLASSDPFFSINETDATANNRLWDFGGGGEALIFRALTDAGVATTWLQVDRTAGIVDSINLQATAVQANGVPLATQASGTQAMTQTGCAGGANSPNVRWVRTGNVVVLELPTVTCTSNATSWTWTGLPASIRPPNGWTGAALACIVDNGAQTCGNGAAAIDSAGVINFLRNASTTGWTASGNKNVAQFTSVTYGIL